MENKNQPAIYWGMAMAMETPQHTMPKTPKSGGHLTIIFIISENHEILREADTWWLVDDFCGLLSVGVPV